MEAHGDDGLTGTTACPVDDEELFTRLAERLRVAHRLVASLDLPAAEKSSVSRQLRVITDASKHDLKRASERLEAFLEDLETRRPTGPPET